jgi:hypothetical protein
MDGEKCDCHRFREKPHSQYAGGQRQFQMVINMCKKFVAFSLFALLLGCHHQRRDGVIYSRTIRFKVDPGTFFVWDGSRKTLVSLVSVKHITAARGEASGGWFPLITTQNVRNLV